MSHQGETCKDPVKLCKYCPAYIAHKSPTTPKGRAYMPPAHLAYTTNLNPPPPCRGRACRPATYPIPQLVAIAQQIHNMHLAQKSPSKFVEKIKNNP